MSQANAFEQYMLELVNAERAKTGAQPLAFDVDLNESAELHSRWMLDVDIFSHTGVNGTDAGQRMAAAGYSFTGAWSWAENVAWVSTRSPTGYQDEVLLLHTNLMNSPGHRANILTAEFREVGIGLEIGDFQGWNAAMVTQNFAKTGGNPFLTGVAFDDKDGDRFYDVGEGLGQVTVKITNVSTGAVQAIQTGAAGGYGIDLAAGSYSVSFNAAGLATQTQVVTIGTSNVKLDWVDPAVAGEVTAPAPATISGTSGADRFDGTMAADSYRGLSGADTIQGGGGDDLLDGGAGGDWISGGAGRDTLTGGAGSDKFIFDTAPAIDNVDTITDFSTVYDTIRLENGVFTGLGSWTGTLASSAFQKGSVALDASDRILYDAATGKLFYDADGTGDIAPVQFAQLSANLNLTASDFVVF